VNEFLESAEQTGRVQLTSNEREVNTYKKKQSLYSEGQRPVAVYFIIEGKVKVSRTNEDLKELITNIYGPGDFFGYTSILEETNYKDNAEILEDAELMLIPRKDFLELINNDAAVARQFIRLLTHNVMEKEESLLNLAYSSLRKKVANGLIQVLTKFKDGKGALEISRENLANIIGSATESLIRTLSDFKSEGLIDIKHGKIIIVDEKKLRNLLY
jgi:CRP/FNR family transcriptional regulator, cyclic AMP receptor protein